MIYRFDSKSGEAWCELDSDNKTYRQSGTPEWVAITCDVPTFITNATKWMTPWSGNGLYSFKLAPPLTKYHLYNPFNPTCIDCDTWIGPSDSLYCEATAMSCCGKYGVDIWDTQRNQWKCSKCGAIKSNDPNYVYNSRPNSGVESSPPVSKNLCLHIWKQYHGLKESFEYCDKCDEKKNVQ